MTRTEVAIHDIAEALLGVDNLTMPREKKLDIYVRSLQGLVNYAICEHLTAPIIGAQNDLATVEQIRRDALKD